MKAMNRCAGLLQIIIFTLFTAFSMSWAADAGIDASAKTYGSKCASCHAKDAKGNPAMAKVFKIEPPFLDLTKKATLDKSDADLAKVTKDGLNKMPAYKEKLTDADISAVIAYVRGLGPKADQKESAPATPAAAPATK